MDAKNRLTEFERKLVSSNNQLGMSMLVVLSWIALADGVADKNEMDHIAQVAASSKTEVDHEFILRVVKQKDIRALQLSCEVLKRSCNKEMAPLLVQLAITTAAADGRFSPEEIHIIQFLADLLQVERRELNEIFTQITGKPSPAPADLSRRENWSSYGNDRNESNSKSHDNESRKEKSSKESVSSEKEKLALATLGLDPGVSKKEIKVAYRRLVQIHHPDRFASLGDEAVAAANNHFKKIQEAYEYLVRHA